jgi:hypothetical protein
VEATQSSTVDRLVIWIPDDLAKPNTDKIQGLLGKQMEKFTTQNPSITVDIRVKHTDGMGSLMDTLQSASLAAPGSLPDLVLLSDDEMETSALKGLLIPFDDVTDIFSSPDWSPVMLQLGQIQGSTFGIPALADATVLVTKTGSPVDSSIYNIDHPILCYLDDPQGLFMVGLYLSAGGDLQNDSSHSNLDEKKLTAALGLVDSALATRAFSSETMAFSSDQDAIRHYEAGKGDQLISWYTSLPAVVKPASLNPVPGVGNASASLVRGYFWSMANRDPARREATVALAEILSEPQFLADIAAATHSLPVRESADMKKNPDLDRQFSVLKSGHPMPDGLLLVTLGLALQDALVKLQGSDVQPADLAKKISAGLNKP